MATGSYMTPIYSRSQSEVLGDFHTITVDVVNPTHTVTFSSCNGVSTTVLGFSVAQILQLWVLTDPRSVK
ncbi:hypothetical protein TNCV_3052641 [Trichonephila clavipes]|nr:hypothetical protein TNCV_3052641 [Trichonephila clavipes]